MAKRAQHSNKSLVIVESPAKAKTINRYLGADYEVLACMGHVRDLPVHELGIDLDNNFEPVYEILAAKRKTINALKKSAAKATAIYFATDLDREGEAIAWHLAEALGVDPQKAQRVVFNEITKSAIKAAFAKPHGLDMNKVCAQQARRLLDRIVGYQLSPLLQAKIGKGLSAGRVQSVAVRIIVERESEIQAFVPEESWRISGIFGTDLAKREAHRAAWSKFLEGGASRQGARTVKERNAWLSKHLAVSAELIRFNGKDFRPSSVDEARNAVEAIGFVVDDVVEGDFEGYADKGLKTITIKGVIDTDKTPTFSISDVQTRSTTTKPNPPFATASLQQAASSAMGFAPSRTMRIAQQLYEGIDLGDSSGPVGLITYMRTDSMHMSRESVEAARQLIRDDFTDHHVPAKPNVYGKAKRAQEAHEAIRPSDVTLKPDALRSSLTKEQFKLYDLIWRRFVACQMTPAKWDNTSILISAETPDGEATFRASGRRLVFDGFLRVAGISEDGEVVLPEITKGAEVAPLQIAPQQMYTSPPARYSEATLVKKMEAEGIGRPSTYAAVIQTIQDRGYVELTEKKLRPTARGEIVTEKLIAHFPKIMDIKFTSFMEEELDKVEDAHVEWTHVLREFYEPFKKSLDRAQTEMERVRAEPSEYTCKDCGKQMVYRLGRNGRFLSCSDYPKCKVSMNIDAEGKPVAAVVAKEPCVLCGKEMILRKSRIGPFLGCSGYPECTNTLPSDEDGVPLRKIRADEIDQKCEDCGSKMEVKFARGRSFLGCSGYPKCKATQPMPPGVYVEKPKPKDAGVGCDKCGRPMVIRKSRRGPFLSCSGFPRCRNAMPVDKLDHLKALAAAGEIPDPPADNGRGGSRGTKNVPRDAKGKVDIAALGPPPPGFAWTRTGRPVVETWPEDSLICPDCGEEVVSRTGRFGPYFGCTRYPKCSFVANLRGAAKKHAEAEIPGAVKPKPVATDIPCDECDATMVIRQGRSGPFLGCSKYPKCRCSKPLPEGVTAETFADSKS